MEEPIPKVMSFQIQAGPDDAGKRLDRFLIEFANKNNLGFSRTFLQRLLKQDKVFLNGVICSSAHHKVQFQDKISFGFQEAKEEGLYSENIPLEVVYEDSDLAVINKPAGLVVHPAPGNLEHTLVNAAMHRFKTLSSVNPARPGIVHRLDKETSGLLVIARNNQAHQNLAKQFAEHSIKRRYIALVEGKVEFDEDVIEVPIGRHPRKRKNMSVGYGPESKYARTRYRTISRSEKFSLLELEPFTGRTHQLRVHLAFLGHPILGDSKYGKEKSFKRLGLHAKSIGFIHPRTGKFIEFSSPLPEEFLAYLEKNKP